MDRRSKPGGYVLRLSWLLLGLLTLSACVKKSGHLDYGLDVKETLRININQEPPTLDWLKASDTTSGMVIDNIMDKLVEFDLADPELKIIPSLATAWEPSEKGRVWTFTLRKGVKWSDGVEFTGQQMLDAWEYLLNPKTASEQAYYLFAVKNARPYNAGKIKDFAQVGVHVDARGRLVVELENPISYFPMLLTHHATAPARKDLITKFGNQWTNPENMQTLGAFKLKYWDHDKSIVLERFENYWGEKPQIRNIIAYMINEYSTALNLYDSGRLDFQETIPFKELPRYINNPGFHPAKALSLSYYGFNVRKPPFDNVKVRQAFSYAVDRKQITALLNAGQTPLTGWVPDGMFGHETDLGISFDKEKAARLLDEAGYKDRAKFPKIQLAVNTNENHQRVAENIQLQIKKNLGVNLEISNEEWKVYLSHLRSDPPNLFRMAWLANYPDPDDFLNLMTGASDNNFSGWKNKKFDAIVSEARSELDKSKRRALYRQGQKILTEEDVPSIPLFSDVRPILLSARVDNFVVNSMNRWLFKGVRFK